MSAPAPPPAKPPPPAPRASPAETSSNKTFTIGKSIRVGKRIGIYGPGGCGKTSLAKAIACAGKRAVWLDIEKSADDFGVDSVPEIGPDSEWADVRAALKAPIWNGVDVIVIDSVTKLEEMCMAHVFATVPKNDDKGGVKEYTDTLEGYGYGKGYGHLYNKFIPVFQDLERHSLAGRHIIMVCHDIIGEAKNPDGENYERMEPRLMNSPKFSIRNRFREWLTDLWCIRYDVNVNKDGKASGGGSRAIYTAERPTYWAKSRSLDKPYVYTKGDDQQIWKDLFAKE